MTPAEPNSILDAENFWRNSRGSVLLDVRSPKEFEQGHIPDAVSLPLFDDDQRADVGTIFSNSGKNDAVLRGLRLVGPKMADLAIKAREIAGNSAPVFLHCWRGGMRSRSMQWLLGNVDLAPIIMDGGYKAFRQLAQSTFETPQNLHVISGLTGVGKTRVLNILTAHGEAVVDLEGLANHRGSAFGAIGQAPQPTTEQFENDLFAELDRHREAKRIWVEDEGNRLGTVVVPPDFVKQLRRSPGIFCESSLERRISLLMEDYGDFHPERLKESILAIRKRLGFDVAEEIMTTIDQGQIADAIERVLAYYDRTYLHAAAKNPRPVMPKLNIQDLSEAEMVESLIAMADASLAN